jgi:hypothetical protein
MCPLTEPTHRRLLQPVYLPMAEEELEVGFRSAMTLRNNQE